jgi:hypothetical protein
LKKEEEKNQKLEEIYNVKYVGCGYCDDLESEGFQAYKKMEKKFDIKILVCIVGLKLMSMKERF